MMQDTQDRSTETEWPDLLDKSGFFIKHFGKVFKSNRLGGEELQSKNK